MHVKLTCLVLFLKLWSVLLKVSDGTKGFEEYRRYLTEEFVLRTKRVINCHK